MSNKRILVFSAGGNGREIAWAAKEAYGGDAGLAFIDDDPALAGTVIHGLPVLSYQQALEQRDKALVIMAVGNPATRKKLRARCAQDGFSFAGVIDPSARIGPNNNIAADAIICALTIVTCDATLGEGCILNRSVNIGHDTVLGDHVSVAPGTTIGGFVEIGDGAYIGSGATVINGTRDKPLRIGAGAVVGAGACVVRDVAAGDTVGGVPAKSLRK